jgi:hypothetical protein
MRHSLWPWRDAHDLDRRLALGQVDLPVTASAASATASSWLWAGHAGEAVVHLERHAGVMRSPWPRLMNTLSLPGTRTTWPSGWRITDWLLSSGRMTCARDLKLLLELGDPRVTVVTVFCSPRAGLLLRTPASARAVSCWIFWTDASLRLRPR